MVLSVGLSMIKKFILLYVISDGPGLTKGEITDDMLPFCFMIIQNTIKIQKIEWLMKKQT